MVEPRFRWTFPPVVGPSDAAPAAVSDLGISARLAGLLAARGVVDRADQVAWFADPLAGLHDPARLPDADRLLARLRAARDRHERVMVFGDFDADGLTGLAIMTLALRRFGVAVEPYVPSRLDEGHGLSLVGGRRRGRERRDGHHHGRLRHDERRRGRGSPTRAGSTSSSPITTASRRSCPTRSRS